MSIETGPAKALAKPNIAEPGNDEGVAGTPNESYSSLAHVSPDALDQIREDLLVLRQRGDALDTVRKYGNIGWNARVVGFLALSSQIVAGAMNKDAASVGITQFTLPLLAGGALGTYLYRSGQTPYKNRFSQPEFSSYDISEKVEFWSVSANKKKNKDIVMIWTGALGDEQTGMTPELKSSLNIIATIAEENNIPVVVAPSDLLLDVPIASSIGHGVDLRTWTKRRKEIDINAKLVDSTDAQLPMRAFTPEELRIISETLENEERIHTSIKKCIEALRTVNGQHPIVRRYDEVVLPDRKFFEQIRRMAQRAVEMRIGDVEMQRSEDPLVPVRERVNVTAIYGDDKIHWQANGKYDKSQDIEAAIGLSEEEAREIVNFPEVYGASRVLLAAEMLLSQNVALEKSEPIVRYTPVAHSSELSKALSVHNNRRALFSYIRNGKEVTISRPQAFSRVKRMGAAAMLGSVLAVSIGNDQLIEQHDTATEQVTNEYRQQHGLGNGYLSTKQEKEIDAEIRSKYPYSSLYKSVVGVEHMAAEKSVSILKELLEPEAQAPEIHAAIAEPTTVGGSIGNVPNNAPEKTVWNIANAPKTGTTGYWSQSVASIMYRDGYWKIHDVHDEHLGMYTVDTNQSILDSGKYMVVSGQTVTEYSQDYGAVVSVPVLEGYRILATNGNGYVVETRGGGTAIGYDNAGVVDVKYALIKQTQPVNGASSLYNPLETDPNYDENAYYDYMVRSNMEGKVRDEWERAMPHVYDMSRKERLAAQVEYVKNTFSYEIAPVRREIQNYLEEGSLPIDLFVDAQLKEQKANCNVATTLIAASNYEVTPAVGYLSNGDSKLTDREAHMWLVDNNGKMYDPTPTRVIKDGTEPDLPYKSRLPKPEVLGGIVAAGFLLSQRRRIGSAIDKLVVSRVSVKEVREAASVIDSALYASVPQTNAKYEHLRELDKEELLSRLSRPEYHGSPVRTHLGMAGQALGKKDKQKLRKAAKLLRRIGTTRQIQMPFENDGVNKVL